jgi:hypothetical protein
LLARRTDVISPRSVFLGQIVVGLPGVAFDCRLLTRARVS